MKSRVLLADDHALLREGLRALLVASPGVAVVGEANNGREAVRLAMELKPDVVLMDISMPDLNGLEAARMLRERLPAAKVIVLSMHSSTEHVYQAFEAGAAGYVLKASVAGEVKAALAAVRAGQQYLSPALREAYEHARRSPSASPLERLSARERQVLQLVVEGRSSAEIARLVHLSPKTVETYRSRLMQKLGVPDLPSLVKFALQQGLTPPH